MSTDTIQNAFDLKNAIRMVGQDSNSAYEKAHLIKQAKELNLTGVLPKGWTSSGLDSASSDFDRITCPVDQCSRLFYNEDALLDHAEAVHTFDDTRRAVSDALQDQFGKQGNYSANPPVPGTWTWISDLASDWVAFQAETGGDTQLYKVGYLLDDKGKVTFGEPQKVIRRTVYDPVQD